MSGLNPSLLIGGDLKGMAGLSAFGRIYRLSRLNSLLPWQALDVLGVPETVLYHLKHHKLFVWPGGPAWDDLPIDESKLICPTAEDFMLCVSSEDFEVDPRIRGCATCLKSGFHSLLHQLPWIEVCPWHHETLSFNCRCGRRLFWGSGFRSRPLLLCECGYDHYDRFAALGSLTTWREQEVISAIRRYSLPERAASSKALLVTDGELSVDQAMAAARGLAFPKHFLWETEVIATETDEDHDALCKLVRGWDALVDPSPYTSVRLHPDDTERLGIFAMQLFERVQLATNGASSGPFRRLGEKLHYEFEETDKTDRVNTAQMSYRDIALGRALIRQYVDAYAPSPERDWADWNIWTSWESRRETAVAQGNGAALQLLARTLSAISAHALMEQWTFHAWRAYSEEEGWVALKCFGHPIVLMGASKHSVAKVVRLLSLPEFKDPKPEQAWNYRRPTHSVGGVRSRYFWSE